MTIIRRTLRVAKRVAKRIAPGLYFYLRYGQRNPNTRRYWDHVYAAQGRSSSRDYVRLHDRISCLTWDVAPVIC